MSTPPHISQSPSPGLPDPGSLPTAIRRRVADAQLPVFSPERITAAGRQIFSNEQKTEMIRFYDRLPHGSKLRFLTRNGVPHQVFRRWRRQVLVARRTVTATFDPDDPAGRRREFDISTLDPAPEDEKELTAQRKRDLVIGYLTRPYGQKKAFLDYFHLTYGQITRWEAAMADGDLDKSLVPRKTGIMTADNVHEITRLRQLIAAQQQELSNKDSRLDQQNRALNGKDDEINKLIQVADALGKAIKTTPAAGGDYDGEENTSP